MSEEKGLFIRLSSNPADSFVSVDGNKLGNVTKVAVIGYPDRTDITLSMRLVDNDQCLVDVDENETITVRVKDLRGLIK